MAEEAQSLDAIDPSRDNPNLHALNGGRFRYCVSTGTFVHGKLAASRHTNFIYLVSI